MHLPEALANVTQRPRRAFSIEGIARQVNSENGESRFEQHRSLRRRISRQVERIHQEVTGDVRRDAPIVSPT